MILGNNWNLGRVPGTELEHLGRLKIAVMVRARHPLADATRVSLADLEDYPVASAVELPTGSVGLTGAFVCDNFHVLREAVLQTDCVWFSSPVFLLEDIRAGRIVQLDVTDLSPAHSDICLVTKRGRTRSPAAVTLAAEVGRMLAEDAQRSIGNGHR